MFYKITVRDHIRVPPKIFNLPTKDAVIQMIKKKFEGFISGELGVVIDVADVNDIKEGVVIPGDGASYFDTEFELYSFKPEMQEAVYANVRDIADFGAFMNIGPIEGMIHIGQTMDDYVSFSKDKVLTGKETKRTLKVNDRCKARIVAVSYKDVNNPKIALTMRQPLLGRLDWVEEEINKKSKGGDDGKKEGAKKEDSKKSQSGGKKKKE
ncbi:MAG: DNA-directed RNA polymerase [Candidatus Woesearchaeota archaeon]